MNGDDLIDCYFQSEINIFNLEVVWGVEATGRSSDAQPPLSTATQPSVDQHSSRVQDSVSDKEPLTVATEPSILSDDTSPKPQRPLPDPRSSHLVVLTHRDSALEHAIVSHRACYDGRECGTHCDSILRLTTNVLAPKSAGLSEESAEGDFDGNQLYLLQATQIEDRETITIEEKIQRHSHMAAWIVRGNAAHEQALRANAMRNPTKPPGEYRATRSFHPRNGGPSETLASKVIATGSNFAAMPPKIPNHFGRSNTPDVSMHRRVRDDPVADEGMELVVSMLPSIESDWLSVRYSILTSERKEWRVLVRCIAQHLENVPRSTSLLHPRALQRVADDFAVPAESQVAVRDSLKVSEMRPLMLLLEVQNESDWPPPECFIAEEHGRIFQEESTRYKHLVDEFVDATRLLQSVVNDSCVPVKVAEDQSRGVVVEQEKRKFTLFLSLFQRGTVRICAQMALGDVV